MNSLLQHCGDCVNENTNEGHAEFLARRQEEYQRTLRVIYGQVTESAQDYTAAESTYSGFGTFNTNNELQSTITCNSKQ